MGRWKAGVMEVVGWRKFVRTPDGKVGNWELPVNSKYEVLCLNQLRMRVFFFQLSY